MQSAKTYWFCTALLMQALLVTSCEDFIKPDLPTTEVTTSTVFASNETAVSAIRAIYETMSSGNSFNNTGIALLTGMSADEFDHVPPSYSAFLTNNIDPRDVFIIDNLWAPAYRYIYMANAVLDGLKISSAVTEPVRKQLEGEALFVRAFCHFYLTNLFGEVPYVEGTEVEANAHVSRMGTDEVYARIIADLTAAKDKLAIDFSFTQQNARIRPTRWAACALLSRVYLYQQQWALAEDEATLVINQTGLFSVVNDPANVFLAESREAIWQLLPVIPDIGTTDALVFVPLGLQPTVSLRTDLLDAFDASDKRLTTWIGGVLVGGENFYYPAKYKHQFDHAEFHAELRLAELHLNRAEARANLNNLDAAISDLDIVHMRAGLPSFAASENTFSKEALINLILHERRVELFAESGHRWFDLKRTEKAGGVLTALPYKDWQDTDVLYPVPQSEINDNRNLEPQNEGYLK